MQSSVHIAFASDTQAPMFVETLLLKAQKNRLATKLLFQEIVAIHPHTLFLLGDVVNLGYSDRQWKPIDEYLQTVRDKGIEIHAIMGNHEVMGRRILGERKFQQRFPTHNRLGYFQKIESIAVVLLNSNWKSLTLSEEHQQLEWYTNTLEMLDADPDVQFIIICCHHSPYTNSRIVKASVEVQEYFVPAYIKSRKAQLFLSGHAHAFEHFKVKGKDFMVIGGGGGLRQPLRQNVGTLADLAADYKPMFHYLTVKASGDHLEATSHHLKKDFTGFEVGLVEEIKKTEAVLHTTLVSTK